MGLLAAFLSACTPGGPRLDTAAAATTLDEAVAAVPGYLRGHFQVRDSAQTGQAIIAVLAVDAADLDGVRTAFTACMHAMLEAWEGIEHAPVASVRVEARAGTDPTIALKAPELIGRTPLDTVTTQDLADAL